MSGTEKENMVCEITYILRQRTVRGRFGGASIGGR